MEGKLITAQAQCIEILLRRIETLKETIAELEGEDE